MKKKKRSYLESVKMAIFYSYGDYIRIDAVSGNGFTIFLYGLKLMVMYCLSFFFRLLVAITFPLSALLIMRCKL